MARGKETVRRRAQNVQKRLKAATEASIRATALEVDYRIRKRTPVDTGAARANWKLGIGKPARGATRRRIDYWTARDEAIEAASKIYVGVKIYFTNALKYIPLLENGSSKQAPQGMLRITKAEIPYIARTIGKAAFDAVMKGRRPPEPKRF